MLTSQKLSARKFRRIYCVSVFAITTTSSFLNLDPPESPIIQEPIIPGANTKQMGQRANIAPMLLLLVN